MWTHSKPGLAVLSWVATVLCSFGVEWLASSSLHSRSERGNLSVEASGRRVDRLVLLLHWLLCSASIAGPVYWVWHSEAGPVPSMIYLGQSVVLWMKMISYAHVNRAFRKLHRFGKCHQESDSCSSAPCAPSALPEKPRRESSLTRLELVERKSEFTGLKDIEEPFVDYPKNLTLGHVAYFCVAPTLCYQLNFPRSPTVRWRYVLSLVVRLVVTTGLILFFVEQYIAPTLGTLGEIVQVLYTTHPLYSVYCLLSYWDDDPTRTRSRWCSYTQQCNSYICHNSNLSFSFSPHCNLNTVNNMANTADPEYSLE